jgi:hypothetical protein
MDPSGFEKYATVKKTSLFSILRDDRIAAFSDLPDDFVIDL